MEKSSFKELKCFEYFQGKVLAFENRFPKNWTKKVLLSDPAWDTFEGWLAVARPPAHGIVQPKQRHFQPNPPPELTTKVQASQNELATIISDYQNGGGVVQPYWPYPILNFNKSIMKWTLKCLIPLSLFSGSFNPKISAWNSVEAYYQFQSNL